MFTRTLKDYEEVAGNIAVYQLRQLADKLNGATAVHVNSTKAGGGVAEILHWMLPLMNDLGIRASWEVMEGNNAYFDVTKAFHNGLQGNPTELTQQMIDTYEETVNKNSERLRKTLEKADFVFIHDPQPAALIELCPKRQGKWVWRCHIDTSSPNRKVWKYINSKVTGYDASIFSMKYFAQPLPHPQFLISPSIDPLSDKNCELSTTEIKETLATHGIPDNVPILTQVSRFDRFKDPLGVIQAFKILQKNNIHAELVLVGGGADDDPEGAEVLKEVKKAASDNPHIHVLLLPSDANRTINALQRASTIIIQKSLQEGFGLTVTEGLWKEKPVLGGNVGGIRLQIHNHYTGYLAETPEGAALRIMEMLKNPNRIKRMGKTGKQFVKENFLLTRHLREYLTLMLGLQTGTTNYVMAEGKS